MNITVEQKDMLTELINIGIGHAASTLNCLINHRIRLSVPEIEFHNVEEMQTCLPVGGDLSLVTMSFKGGFDGNASLVFPVEAASTLVAVLTGGEVGSTELDDLRSGTLAEVGNILLNGVMGTMSNMLASRLEYSLPLYQESSLYKILGNQPSEIVLMARANFYVDELCIEGYILLFFEVESFHRLTSSMNEVLIT